MYINKVSSVVVKIVPNPNIHFEYSSRNSGTVSITFAIIDLKVGGQSSRSNMHGTVIPPTIADHAYS